MRLFREEKPGLKTGKVKLFLLFILHSTLTFSQIPINGFCKYNNFSVDSGFTSLFQLNFNNDAWSDIVLYNPAKRDLRILTGEANGTFRKPLKFNAPVSITSIGNIISSSNVVTGYFYISRKEMLAGNIEFGTNGKPSVKSKIKLQSYPDFLNIKDIDGNDTAECLISGSSYEGISVIYDKGSELLLSRAVQNGVYARAYFSDLSNDGIADIAAQNIINNSIELFYNNSGGQFYRVREIPFDEKIYSFRMIDIDLDGYDDIVVGTGRRIVIYFGDNTSSYETTITLYSSNEPESFLTADYNSDGYIDIAYINREGGTLSIFFASGSRSYHNEIPYLKKKNVQDIIPYYSKFVNGLLVLSTSGHLYSVTNLRSIGDYVDMACGINPSVIRYFDFRNDGIFDFAFIDEYDLKIKIITRDKSGIPSLYYSFPLFADAEEFLIERVTEVKKRFICYSPGSKLIEIIDGDLSRGAFSRSTQYTPGIILDIKSGPDEDNKPLLYAAFSSGGKLGLMRIAEKDSKFTLNTTFSIAGNVQDAWFGMEKSTYVYYWKRQGNSYGLSRISYDRMFDDIKHLGSLVERNPSVITGISGKLLNTPADLTIGFLSGSGENLTISASDSLFLILSNKSVGGRVINNRHQLFYGETKFGAPKKLCCYDPSGKVVYTASIINPRRINYSDLVSAPGVKSFFVKNMSFRNYHLVYTNSVENCITIIQL